MSDFLGQIHWPTVITTIVIIVVLGMIFGRHRG